MSNEQSELPRILHIAHCTLLIAHSGARFHTRRFKVPMRGQLTVESFDDPNGTPVRSTSTDILTWFMKLSPILLLATCLVAHAQTEEHINKRFAVQPGGKLDLEVDFGSIDVSTSTASEVIVDVVRKITRATKAEEEEFLADRPVTFAQEGNSVTITSRPTNRAGGSSRGKQRTE